MCQRPSSTGASQIALVYERQDAQTVAHPASEVQQLTSLQGYRGLQGALVESLINGLL